MPECPLCKIPSQDVPRHKKRFHGHVYSLASGVPYERIIRTAPLAFLNCPHVENSQQCRYQHKDFSKIKTHFKEKHNYNSHVTALITLWPDPAAADVIEVDSARGVCGEDAHQAVRLIFHDSIGFSQEMHAKGIFSGGGADGSVLVFPDVEANRSENAGIADGVNGQLRFLAAHPVTAADLVRFAAAVGITNCPGASRLKFFTGRPNATAPSPEGLVPNPADSVTKILARFADAGNIAPAEVVALLASHSIANANFVWLKGIGFPGSANNSVEVSSPLPIGTTAQPGELRLQSDFALAQDPRTACVWQSFINDQELMQNAFIEAVDKMSRIGLAHPENLIDCSVVVPQPVAKVTKPATYPATKSFKDIQRACFECFESPFSSLASDPGPTETLVAGQVGT
ncbi:class II peroxidase [Sphaerobolus stellatus SS14]|uniref:Peroxidase n=1 Tax=Sphaerobolus stellatus (strain SS14) TaxID=990650 RepID=A0A0C9U078_SPHS4|nr:class II peroxidase [Sphaerobolus stellatus SS14]